MDSILDADVTSTGTCIMVAVGWLTVYILANQFTTTDTQLPTDFTTMDGLPMSLG